MRKRITDSEFRKRVNQKQGNQFTILSDYKGSKSKVKIRCNKCDWIGEVTAGNLLHQNYGVQCPTHGKRKFNSSSFQKRVKQIHGDQFIVLSGYHNMQSKVEVRCNKCNWTGKVLAGNLLSRDFGSRCPNHRKRQFDSSSFQKVINEKQDNQYTLLSEYTGYKNKVKVKCNKCGKEFYVWPKNLLRRRIGKNCNHKKCKHRFRLNFKQASKWLSENSNKKIKLVNFSGMRYVATFKCCKCGNVWRARAYHVFSGSTGCPACSSSKGEKTVTEYLKKKGYHFESQFRIKTCKDILPLPFDFAVRNKDNSLNCLIEYQGCQHFIDLSQYKKNDFMSKKSVSRTQKHDAMKLSFCQKHGIKLIYINHPQTTSESRKRSFIADLVKRTLDKELKVS